ncbi:hypothetical protein ILUMI_00747 [Ignelater luminosus]|uniref:Uncharacterized protein n=1 Tax=Ignelater luminosus TaxID=2038154 RepID=A0A8K0GI43_IGNLU|nr:hypothetical protein ILUMI_00747 [Ignelater luminosus]
MFTDKQTRGDKLPPTRGSLLAAFKKDNFKALAWSKDDESQPIIPNPVRHDPDLLVSSEINTDGNFIFWPEMATAHYAANVIAAYEDLNINYVPKEQNVPNVP